MIMVDICERPMDDDEDADCPICLATLSFSALRTHLATHLEELALFVLPCHMEDRSQDVGSDKAEGATGQSLASNASSSEDGLPPLDFEKSLPDTSHTQDPEIFSALLQSTMELKHKDIEDWFLTNGQTKQRDDGDSVSAIEPVYRDQGLWDEAEELEVQVMEMRETELGSDDPDTLASVATQQAARQTQEQQPDQQQNPGQPQPPLFELLSDEQLAALTPDQRKQYFQSLQRFQQRKPEVSPPPAPTPEDMTRFHSIKQEELSKFKASDDLMMDHGTRKAVATKLVNIAPKISNVSRVAPRWFSITHDEDRLRVFFRTVGFSLYSPIMDRY